MVGFGTQAFARARWLAPGSEAGGKGGETCRAYCNG